MQTATRSEQMRRIREKKKQLEEFNKREKNSYTITEE
jgi:hypothetical protein